MKAIRMRTRRLSREDQMVLPRSAWQRITNLNTKPWKETKDEPQSTHNPDHINPDSIGD